MKKRLSGKEMLVMFLGTKDSKWILEYIEGSIICVALARQNGGRWAERANRICIDVAVRYLKNERGIDLDTY